MDDKNKCHVCGRDAFFYSGYMKKELCLKHFERMLISRARSTVKSEEYKKRTFRIRDDGSAASVFLKFIFREDGKSSLTLSNLTVEDFTIDVLRYFIRGKKPRDRVATKNTFNPLYTTSESELEAFMSAKQLAYKKRKRSEDDSYLLGIADDVEKRRPGGMISAVRIGRRMGII